VNQGILSLVSRFCKTLAPALLMAGLTSGRLDAGEFYFGADLSYVNEMEDCGAVYREHGKARDPFELFAERGANLVRVRLWNDAEWTEYSDLADVKRTISRARAQDLAVLLDFHYSDDWADGDKQIIPRAWEKMTSPDELAQALYEFTLDTLLELRRDGLLPEMVQVGNETNPELMRGPDDGKDPIDWERNAKLFNAGIRAVREASPQSGAPIEVMLHIAQPENVLPWFEAAWQAGVRDFDQVGVSYYRRWSSENFEGLSRTLKEVKTRYPSAEVILVETAYPWTLESADSAANLLGESTLIDGYPATVDGQTAYHALPDSLGTGISLGKRDVLRFHERQRGTADDRLHGPRVRSARLARLEVLRGMASGVGVTEAGRLRFGDDGGDHAETSKKNQCPEIRANYANIRDRTVKKPATGSAYRLQKRDQKEVDVFMAFVRPRALAS
jgi:arabinogalactan endo-1,4-beta-galactosidase